MPKKRVSKKGVAKPKANRGSRRKQTNGIVTALVILALLLTCGLVFCAMQMKSTEEEKILDFYPTLLAWYTDECPIFDDNPYYGENGKLVIPERKFYRCTLEEYGISKDGDLFAKFKYQKFNPESGEFEGEIETKTMYFQRDGELEDGKPRYARALGE